MQQIPVVLAVVGATVLLLGLFSQTIKRTVLQEPLLAVAVGVLVGPQALDWLDVERWGDVHAILEQLAELTLAIALMAVALRITPQHLRALWRPVGVLLVLGMLAMWGVSSLLAAWALGLPLWLALLLGAAVTPTDPVIASSIVTGRFAERHLPDKIRTSLSLESGANDGLALLFITLPIFVLGSSQQPWQRWLVEALAAGVLLALALGMVIGYAAGHLLHWAMSRKLIESYSFLTFTVTLSLFTLGVAKLLGAGGLLTVFVAGLVFNLYADTGERHEEERIQEGISKLFLLPMFVVFGVAVPWDRWAELGWPLVALAALTLLLRRLPMMAVLQPVLRRTYGVYDAAFIGWFGPVGVAAVYYASLAAERTGHVVVWEAASAVVLVSILAHGVTAAPLSRLYARLTRDSAP